MHTQTHYRSVLDHPWRIVALLGVVANVAFNYATSAGAFHAMSVADTSNQFPSLFTPAGYAFSIWGLIYASTLVYAVVALLPSQWDVRMHDLVAPWLLLTNVLASVWIALFTTEQLGPSVLVILAMLTSAGLAFSIASDEVQSERLSRWWRAPFALWLGWLAVASLANLSVALVAAGGTDFVLAGPVFTCVLLVVAALFAFAVNIFYGDAVVPLVVGWAAAAIAVARWEDSALVVIVASLVAVKSVLWSAATLLFHVFPMPLRYRKAAGRALRYDPAHPDGM